MFEIRADIRTWSVRVFHACTCTCTYGLRFRVDCRERRLDTVFGFQHPLQIEQGTGEALRILTRDNISFTCGT